MGILAQKYVLVMVVCGSRFFLIFTERPIVPNRSIVISSRQLVNMVVIFMVKK